MAKIGAVFKIGYVKFWVWHEWAFELMGPSVLWRSKQHRTIYKGPSLTHQYNRYVTKHAHLTIENRNINQLKEVSSLGKNCFRYVFLNEVLLFSKEESILFSQLWETKIFFVTWKIVHVYDGVSSLSLWPLGLFYLLDCIEAKYFLSFWDLGFLFFWGRFAFS